LLQLIADTMISLLLLVLLLQILVYLINTIGAKSINDLAWAAYTRLPISASKLPREQLILRNDVLKLKREMHGTSSQDEFAKWAKIRRQHDKKQAEYDQKTEQMKSTRSQFDTVVTGARWFLTTGLRTFLQFWHAKTPVFTYPRDWLPWYVEWVLGFPRAPYGSVSVQVWGTVCGVVVALVGDTIGSTVVTLLSKRQARAKKGKKEPMKMASSSGEKSAAKAEL